MPAEDTPLRNRRWSAEGQDELTTFRHQKGRRRRKGGYLCIFRGQSTISRSRFDLTLARPSHSQAGRRQTRRP